MHLILNGEEYHVATTNIKATVSLLDKPLDVSPEINTSKKEELTKYKVLVLQLDAYTKKQINTYLTQEYIGK